jgi:GNAT superfamily N-acetyltransferase
VIVVDNARPEDLESMAELAEEMDTFYGATEIEPLDLRSSQISDAIFGDPPVAYLIVARRGETLTGFAAYSFLWPAVGMSSSLYLKEMYVASSARRQGVGKLLMERLFEIALQHQCTRVEWTTDHDNRDAQQFYAALGYRVDESKLFYRAERADLLSSEPPRR